jgi:hypothetical protein
MSYFDKIGLLDGDGNPVDSQYPLSVDGDSVYFKDIDVTNSNIGSFTGAVTDLFDDFHSENVAAAVGSGGVNPKFLEIHLDRPILSSFIAFGSPDTSISNAKLIIYAPDDTVIRTVDMSADSTKRGIVFFPIEQIPFISMRLEFHTNDEVTLRGSAILKSQHRTISAIDGLIPLETSTTAQLGNGGVWTSGSIDTKNYGIMVVSVHTDQASATDGLSIEFSTDQTNWYWTDVFTIAANASKTFSVQPQARYMRVKYTNGTVTTTELDIQTQLKPVYIKPSSHRIADPISGQDDAELVKSILTGQDEISGIFENVKTFDGSLSVNTALVHKVGISLPFHKNTAVSSTLNGAISAGDTSIILTSATGFIVGDEIHVVTGSEIGEAFAVVTAIVTNTLTLDRPFAEDIADGATVNVVETDMSSTAGTLGSPVIYQIAPPAGAIWQITRLLISIADNTSMDDGTFGGITALTNGVLLRGNAATVRNATLWKNNGDIALDMYDVTYTAKAPAGENGLRGRWTFTKGEFIVELDGDQGDAIEFLIQDDLTALTSFKVRAQGRLYGG